MFILFYSDSVLELCVMPKDEDILQLVSLLVFTFLLAGGILLDSLGFTPFRTSTLYNNLVIIGHTDTQV